MMSNLSQFYTSGTTIKSIQRGLITLLNGGSTTATATITSVDTTKTELRILGTKGGTNDNESANIVLTNSTKITATRTTNTANLLVSWELTEWN